jgi:hypothetical protein
METFSCICLSIYCVWKFVSTTIETHNYVRRDIDRIFYKIVWIVLLNLES